MRRDHISPISIFQTNSALSVPYLLSLLLGGGGGTGGSSGGIPSSVRCQIEVVMKSMGFPFINHTQALYIEHTTEIELQRSYDTFHVIAERRSLFLPILCGFRLVERLYPHTFLLVRPRSRLVSLLLIQRQRQGIRPGRPLLELWMNHILARTFSL
jgi:hypothetical protein